ncbi:MAG TPA: hypothetical protein VGM88_17285 [Kofleriaceae bacterium]
MTFALGSGGTAFAQSASAQADALFKRGKELEAAGKIADACAAFEGSQKLDPATTTLLNIAACRERNGQLATAYGDFEEAARQSRGTKPALEKTANERAAKLEGRLSKLTINVPHAATGETVTRGDASVDSAVWGQPLPVDGGTYTIVAKADGHKAFTTTVTLANEGDTKSVELPALVPDPKAIAVAQTNVTRPIGTPPPPPPSAHGGHKTLGLSLVIGGGVGIAGSLVFGKLAMNKWSDAKDLCGSGATCNMPGNESAANKDVNSSHTYGWVATGVGAAGVVAAGVGIYFLVKGGGGEHAEHAQLVPVITPTTAGLALSGSL